VSPGGSAVKYMQSYSHIQRLKNRGYEVIALAGSLCASGGYMLALACDKIICEPYSSIGSVGVITAGVNCHELFKKVGITYKTFSTGKCKSPYPLGDEITEENIAVMQQYLTSTQEIFKNMVAKARNLTNEELEEILTANVWYGEDAKRLKLVDEIMMSEDYIEMLIKNKNIVFNVNKIYKPKGFVDSLLGTVEHKTPTLIKKIIHTFSKSIYNSTAIQQYV
jgi:signal peptide peptidase SppA